jgi:hypothetical protein
MGAVVLGWLFCSGCCVDAAPAPREVGLVCSGSVRALPGQDGFLPWDIPKGLSKQQVLAVLQDDWTGQTSLPDNAMYARDVWEVTRPWRLGRQAIAIQFERGVVVKVSDLWIAP